MPLFTGACSQMLSPGLDHLPAAAGGWLEVGLQAGDHWPLTKAGNGCNSPCGGGMNSRSPRGGEASLERSRGMVDSADPLQSCASRELPSSCASQASPPFGPSLPDPQQPLHWQDMNPPVSWPAHGEGPLQAATETSGVLAPRPAPCQVWGCRGGKAKDSPHHLMRSTAHCFLPRSPCAKSREQKSGSVGE